MSATATSGPPSDRSVITAHAAPQESRRSGWLTLPGTVLLLLFVLAHAQEAQPFLAPLALAPLALASILRPAGTGQRFRALACVTIAYFALTAVLNGTLSGIDGINFMRRYGAGLYSLTVFYVFLRLASRDREIVPRLLRIGLLATASLSMLYLVALTIHPITVMGIELTRDGKMMGLLGAPNPTAAQLGVFALVGLVGLLSRADSTFELPRASVWAWAPTAICLVGMLVARSRGYTLGLIVAAAYALWYQRQSITRTWLLPLRALAVLGIVVTGALLLGSRFDSPLADDPNVLTRFALWERAADHAARSPLTGLGLGSFQQQHVDTATIIPGAIGLRIDGEYLPTRVAHTADGGLHSHNLYLQLLSEVGLIGTALFFLPLATAWQKAGRWEHMTAGTFRTLLLYLGVAGLTAGLTMTSPTVAWPLFAVAAHVLTEQHSERKVASA